MITRYFIVNSDEAEGFKSNLVPDDDVLPLSNLQSKIVAELSDGRKIIHAIIPLYLVREMQEQTGLIDPLTQEGVVALSIVGKFAGRTREDVLTNFPELLGDKVVGQDENGNDILESKMTLHKWSGE